MHERPRGEHMAWCQERALAYVEAGDLVKGVNSMLSDLDKHPDTKRLTHLGLVGMMEAIKGETDRVRRWIEGFG